MRQKIARIDAVLVQAVIAGALSFAHLHDIADAAGQHGWKAWAYPISVDLLLVAAWRKIRTGGTAAGWCWFLIALTASLGANVATAGLLDLHAVPAWLRILVAGWPALAFLGGTLLAHTRTTPTAVPEPAPAPAEQTTEQLVAGDAPPVEPTPPAPAPAIAPAPAPEPSPALLPEVSPALVTHARKLARDHQAATGARIDTATLRRRLGLPAPLADAIAAQI